MRRLHWMLLILAAIPIGFAFAASGRVIDAATQKPVPDALVTHDGVVSRTDEEGRFRTSGLGPLLAVRAPGYRRTLRELGSRDGETVVALEPFSPRALYLSFYGIGAPSLRQAALELIDETELNALVIDVKSDRGMVPYRSAVPLAAEIGAQRIITVPDIRDLVSRLRQRGVHLIARVVVFKDELLAEAKPELAVKSGGRVWHDREQLAWTDPFLREVWQYNLDIAEEAARLGFDEIQFDYLRFPDAAGLAFSQPSTERNRVAAISGFLQEARRRLAPYNVFVSADVFGYVAWNTGDTDIGQRLDALAPQLDFISPMLYPSGFQFGIPGCANPVAHPYEIVYKTLAKARERTGLASARFRPWLQAFRDYAFDRRAFGGTEVRAQIRASEEFGTDGWMLWNPHNVYSRDGLRAVDRTPGDSPP